MSVHDASAAEKLSAVEVKDGLPYFTYTDAGDERQPMNCLNIGFLSGDSGYIVQFFCYEQEYEPYYRDDFFRWAGTIRFS